MSIDASSLLNRTRWRAIWSTFGLTLVLCAWFGSRDDDLAADVARPLTRATSGATSSTRAASVSAEQLRVRQQVESLRQALAAISARADFPALTDAGRKAWAGTALPVAAAPSSPSSLLAVTAPPPVFPFQWVGMWSQPGQGDATNTVSTAIIAGPHSTWTVRQGDVLDEDWKIASISADHIVVTHLPTSSRQTITMSK